jgi:hypothetical protein
MDIDCHVEARRMGRTSVLIFIFWVGEDGARRMFFLFLFRDVQDEGPLLVDE